jgi:hypothetical protein
VCALTAPTEDDAWMKARGSLGWFSCWLAVTSLSAVAEGTTTDAASEATESRHTNASPSSGSGSVGVHHLFAAGKLMPGVTLRGGSGWFWGTFEGSFLFLVKPPPERSAFLGNQLGGYFMLRPFARNRLELEVGLGADAYPLWGIHGDEWQVALAARVAAHARLYRDLGVFASARAYPLATSGLELGVHRNGNRGFPVMFGAGLEWWP